MKTLFEQVGCASTTLQLWSKGSIFFQHIKSENYKQVECDYNGKTSEM